MAGKSEPIPLFLCPTALSGAPPDDQPGDGQTDQSRAGSDIVEIDKPVGEEIGVGNARVTHRRSVQEIGVVEVKAPQFSLARSEIDLQRPRFFRRWNW